MDKKDNNPKRDAADEILKAANELESKVERAKMSRKDKLKNHLYRHRVGYCTTAGVVAGLAIGATVVAIAAKSGRLVINDSFKVQIATKTENLIVYIEALGDPGNIVQDLTTGTIYASQGEAARALGVNQGAISKHLSGRNPSVNGHIFKKLGKAMVSEGA